MNSVNQQYLDAIDTFIPSLQDFLASGGQDGELFAAVRGRISQLADGANACGAGSFECILKDVEILLARHDEQQRIDNPLEKNMLRLAADWLIQLLALNREGLPEPRSLVLELRHLFHLVKSSCSASRMATEGHFAASVDPFSADPVPDQADNGGERFCPDPFDEDPRISSELDRLQKTITYVKSAVLSRRPVQDPFAADPFETLAPDQDDAKGRTETSGAKADIFSDDPDFSPE